MTPEMGSNNQWLDADEQRAWRGFVDMHAHITSALARQLLRDSDLSLGDYAVLVALSEADGGELRSFAIAEVVGWEPSRLSHQLSRMEKRGLVQRHPCQEDRRGMTTVITPAGRAAIQAAAPGHVAEVRRLFIDRLDDAQLATIAACSDQVLDKLGCDTD